MITLLPNRLHWINETADDPYDLCAHAGVDFRIDGETLIRPEVGIWTVSATALYLLRTLSKEHTKSDPVADHLFPCCGHGMFEVEGSEDVLMMGCNCGIDFEIVHDGGDIFLTAADGTSHRIARSNWQSAVCQFSDAVRAFYANASEKQGGDDFDQKGFEKFLSEWTRRRFMATNPIEE